MKYGLLSVRVGDITNIGDYVQALASSQFLPCVDEYVNREELDMYDNGPIKMIMNGWYMHGASHWPPSPMIQPLFVAFHLNSSVKDQMLSSEGVNYLKSHEPIGCRDYNTVELLKSKGVDAYFSGCMTLTLGTNYKSNKHNKRCYIVDPYIPIKNTLASYCRDFICLLSNFGLASKIRKSLFVGKSGWRPYTRSARFIRLYSKIVSKDVLKEAIYMTQESSYYAVKLASDSQRLLEARRLVGLYAEAGMVITSRIHCALPCLGLETPVLYTMDDNAEEISKCRFKGLSELFNCIHLDNEKIYTDFPYTSKISVDNIVKNKDSWRPLAENLIKKCQDFVNS